MACILALDGFYLDGRNIRASYGTSKYCSAFIKNVRCNNPECTYLHQMGDVEDTFTKQEIQAGYVTSGRDVLARQQQIVQQALSASSGAGGLAPRKKAGGGGPSGTGKAALNPVFPPPTYDEPAKPPAASLVPPPPAAHSRSITTGAAFPSISTTNSGSQTPAVVPSPSPIVRSSSAGGLSSIGPFPGPAPKGSIGSTPAMAARKGVIGSAGINGTMAPPGATAASVVAGVHLSGSSETPAPHTTLTPLTPLKRTTGSKGTAKSSSSLGISGELNSDLNVAGSKGLAPGDKSVFIDQRKDPMSRQQPDTATRLTSLRAGTGKKQNGTRSGGSSPSSPSSQASGAGSLTGLSKISGGTDANIPLIGGSVIAAPGAAIAGGLGSAGSLGELRETHDGLGGLGGEVFDGPLLSSGNKSAIGSGKDKWNSTPIGSIGGDPVYSGNTGGLWAGGSSAAPGSLGSNRGGVIGGSAGTIGVGSHNSGSSALASMLGINLPTGSGTLRDTSNLWGAPASAVQPPIAALNGSSLPAQGIIGPSSSTSSNGLIGGLTIGGNRAPMGVGNIGSGSNKSDIALLQSLLPGVHITSGSAQLHGSGFGTIGAGEWGSRAGNPAQQHADSNGGFSMSEAHQLGHWGGGLQTAIGGTPVGAIGQSGDKQRQRQAAPGSIW